MQDKMQIDLGHVQKTLLLPLWGRAVESRKSQPLLVDEAAVRIINQVDFDFDSISENVEDISQIAWIKRSLYCDLVIRNYLERQPRGTIVNIGCGLDTTFDRVDNDTVLWYDLDLPDVIQLRSQFITETDRRKFIAASFLERDWAQQIVFNGPVLFVSAGVFYYFPEETIRRFVLELIDAFPGSELVFDVSSPLGVRLANKKVVESAGLDERSHLVWGLEKKEDILAWDERLRILGTYSYFRDEVKGTRNRVMGWISDFLGMQYLLHLGWGGS